MYGAEVWQIPTREINKILSTDNPIQVHFVHPWLEKVRNAAVVGQIPVFVYEDIGNHERPVQV